MIFKVPAHPKHSVILWQWDWRIWHMRRSWESLVIQPIKTKLRRIISACTEVNRRQSQTLLGDRRGRRYRKFCLNIEKGHFIVKMEEVAQRSCGGPILRYSKLSRKSWGTCSRCPCMSKELGSELSRVLSCIHKSSILRLTQADRTTCTCMKVSSLFQLVPDACLGALSYLGGISSRKSD